MKLAIALLFAFAPLLAAQSDAPPQPAEKWEYCVVTHGGALRAGSQAQVKASIRYATEKGFREETVEVLVDYPKDPSWVADQAIAKALTQLGAQGWELVSVLPSGLEQYRNNLGFHTHYLKRRLR